MPSQQISVPTIYTFNLERCPHCNVDTPNLTKQWETVTKSFDDKNERIWSIYLCPRCGGLITVSRKKYPPIIFEYFPKGIELDLSIPAPAIDYLKQALNSIQAPAGCVMLCASSIDAMLKINNYKDGSLFKRINDAAKDHLITDDMAKWAHEVRIDANEQRHADDNNYLPTLDDAKRVIEFTLALAQFLFVLPSRVNKGLEDAKSK